MHVHDTGGVWVGGWVSPVATSTLALPLHHHSTTPHHSGTRCARRSMSYPALCTRVRFAGAAPGINNDVDAEEVLAIALAIVGEHSEVRGCL
jgi:hypothetical protein